MCSAVLCLTCAVQCRRNTETSLCECFAPICLLQLLQKRLGVEYERWQQYLDSPTRKPLISIVEQQLLAAHMPLILDKGFHPLMAQKR